MLLNSGPRLRSTSPLAGPSVDHGAIGSVGMEHGLVTRTAPPATGKYHKRLKKQIFQQWSTVYYPGIAPATRRRPAKMRRQLFPPRPRPMLRMFVTGGQRPIGAPRADRGPSVRET